MNGSIIENIYSADLITLLNLHTTEVEKTNMLYKEFLKEQSIDGNSKLGRDISNFALDYSCVSRECGFKEGFCLGIKLMIEVLNNE